MVDDTEEKQQEHLAMLTAIGHCHRLRSVDLIEVVAAEPENWTELLKAICARPKLNALRLLCDDVPLILSSMPKHCFSVDSLGLSDWMEVPSLKQFLARIKNFHYTIWLVNLIFI